MGSYYFASTALPELRIGGPADLSFSELMLLFDLNLTERDLRQVRVIRGLVDLYNLCAFWRDQPLDPRGSLGAVELEEATAGKEAVPEFAARFLEEYVTTEERLAHFGELIVNFFAQEIAEAKGFLKRYLEFERDWRLVMLAFRAKQLGRDVTRELQFEDPYDTIVGQILAQREAVKFEPPVGYEKLRDFVDLKPMELNRTLEEYRFRRLEEMRETEEFSIGYLLGYMVQLMIVERWNELS